MMEAAGINVGFGFTKIVTRTNSHKLASIATKAERTFEVEGAGVPGVEGGFKTRDVVELDGEYFAYGLEAVATSTTQITKPLFRDWVGCLSYRVLAQVVAEKLAVQGRRWTAVVGLAVEHWRDAPELRGKLKEFWQRPFSTRYGIVNFENVFVTLEPLGSLVYARTLPDYREALERESVLVLDFGRLTTNWLVVVEGNVAREVSGSIDKSVSAVLESACARIAKLLNRPKLTPLQLERAMLSGESLYARGNSAVSIDVMEQVRAEVAPVWADVMLRIHSTVDMSRMKIMLTGGGAHLFDSVVRNTLPSTCRVLPVFADPQMANTRGLYCIAQNHADRIALAA